MLPDRSGAYRGIGQSAILNMTIGYAYDFCLRPSFGMNQVSCEKR